MSRTAGEPIQQTESLGDAYSPLGSLIGGPARQILFIAAAMAYGSMAAAPSHASVPPDTLYGTAEHVVFTIDQEDGSISTLTRNRDMWFLGLAFDSGGRLFATGCSPSPCVRYGPYSPQPVPGSLLLELDPVTGVIVDTIGSVTDPTGSPLTIHALSVQPGTNVLYGLERTLYGVAQYGSTVLRMWTIDTATAEATLVASEVPAGCEGLACSHAGGLAFAPDGTLYHGARGTIDELALKTLEPSTGALKTSVRTAIVQALAVRSDGILFASGISLIGRICRTCMLVIKDPYCSCGLWTVDPLTGHPTGLTQGGGGFDLTFSPIVVKPIVIDIKPGNDGNPIHPRNHGVIPVAILGSDTFDVTDVDVSTVAFGPNGASPTHLNGPHRKDANHDGMKDLLVHFRTDEAGISFDDAEACVTGELLNGTPFEGCDGIQTVPLGRGAMRR